MTTADPRASLWSATAADLRTVAEHYRQRAAEPVRWWQFTKKRHPWTWQRQWDAELAAKLDAIADEMTAVEARCGHDMWKHEELRSVAHDVARVVRHIEMAAGVIR